MSVAYTGRQRRGGRGDFLRNHYRRRHTEHTFAEHHAVQRGGRGVARIDQGAYTGTNQFTVDACVTIILKVVMEVELLVPSYGYSAIPPCQEYTQEVCAGFFELPVFPQ